MYMYFCSLYSLLLFFFFFFLACHLTSYFRYGFSRTGETLLILNVPTMSCASEIEVKCYLVPRLRREIRRKFRTRLVHESVGNAFSLHTQQLNILKVKWTFHVLLFDIFIQYFEYEYLELKSIHFVFIDLNRQVMRMVKVFFSLQVNFRITKVKKKFFV